MSRVLPILVISALLAGCGGPNFKLLKTEERVEEIERFYPPLPTPIYPYRPEVRVLTPDVTRAMNEEVDAGEAPPYVFFAFDDQTWITWGQQNERILAHIRELRAILKALGHPELAEDAPPPSE